jgi:hypothetical protein
MILNKNNSDFIKTLEACERDYKRFIHALDKECARQCLIDNIKISVYFVLGMSFVTAIVFFIK